MIFFTLHIIVLYDQLTTNCILLNSLVICYWLISHDFYVLPLCSKGYRTLSQDVEEGICQVLAHMWLESQITSLSCNNVPSTSYSSKHGIGSPYERKLGEFFKHQIESDTSPVYGNGYRAGKMAVLKYGLPETLEHIGMTGTFPY